MEDWQAVTTWLPPDNKGSDCKRLLSKWLNGIGRTEGLDMAALGGIFGNYSTYPPHKMQYHSHLILTGTNNKTGKTIKDIDKGRWRALWNEIANIPSDKATVIKQGDNLKGWLNYIFIKNPKTADVWQMFDNNLSQLYRLNNLKDYLKEFKK